MVLVAFLVGDADICDGNKNGWQKAGKLRRTNEASIVEVLPSRVSSFK